MTTTSQNITAKYVYKQAQELDVKQLIEDLIEIHEDWHVARHIDDLHYDENRLAEIIEVLENYIESQPCK